MDIPKNWPEDVKEAAKHPLNHLGKYIKISKVGEGGMATVFKAWDKELARYVALKFLKATGKEEINRFIREAKVVAKFNHPNIAQVYEMGSYRDKIENKKVYFFSMQYLEGQTIDTVKLPQKVLLKIIHDAALAIHYAHSNGIIHRDIKPSNLMVVNEKGEWRVFVMDFGLAKVTKDMSVHTLTRSGDVMGTPAFMSPEQAKGERRKLDAVSDVYSLGATLYYLLAKRYPFTGDSVYDVIMKVINENPPPLTKVTRVHPDLEIICQKAMEKDKKLRYQSAKEFADDIQRFLEGRPVLARRTTLRIIKKAVKRYPVVIAGAALGVVIFAILILLLIPKPPPPQPTKPKFDPVAEKLIQIYRTTDSEEKIKICQEILKIDPAHERAIEIFKDEISKLIKKAEKLEKEDKLEEALCLYEKVLKYDPENEYAQNSKAKLEITVREKEKTQILAEVKKKLETATEEGLAKIIENLNAFISKKPDDEVYCWLARAFYQKYFLKMDEQDLKHAETFLEKGYEINRMSDYYATFKADIELINYRKLLLRDVMRILLMENPEKEPFRKTLSELKEYAKRLSSMLINLKGLAPGSVAADAYKLYGSGLYYYFIGDKEAIEKAKQRFESCIHDLASMPEPWFMLAIIHLYEKKNYKECIDRLNKYLEIRKNDNTVKTLLALVYIIAGDIRSGLDILSELPQDVVFYYARGMAKKSIDDLRQAIKLDENFTEAYCGLGILYMRMQDMENAISSFQKAITKLPDFPEPFYYRGCIYLQKNEFDKIIEDFEKAFCLGMRNPNLYRKMAEYYTKKGQIPLAIRVLTTLIKEGSPEIVDFITRGNLYLQDNEPSRAISDFSEVLKIDPENIEALRGRAKAYIESYKKSREDYRSRELREQYFNKAIDDLTKILKIQPDNADIYVERALIYSEYEYGSYLERAYDDFSQAIKLKPSAYLYLKRGIISYKQGKFRFAIDDLNESIRLDDKLVDAYFWRAKAREQIADYKGAWEDYNLVTKLKPDHIEAHLGLANIIAKEQKDYKKLIEICDDVISKNPDYAIAYILRARAYEHQGLFEKAIEDLKRAREARIRTSEYELDDLDKWEAELYIKSANAKEAIEIYDKLIQDEQGDKQRYIKRLEERKTKIKMEGTSIKISPWADMLKDTMQTLYNLYTKRARIYKMMGEIDKALNDYISAIKEAEEFNQNEEDPNKRLKLFEDYCQRGKLYMSKQKYDEAVKDFQEAMKINPDEVGPYLLLARAYTMTKYYETALDKCQQALKIAPNNAEIYVEIGDIYRAWGDYYRASENYKIAEKKDKNCARIYLSKARLLERDALRYEQENKPYKAKQQWQRVAEELEQVRKLKASDEIKVEAYLWLVEIYVKLDKSGNEILALLNELVELEPLNARIYLRRAEIYEKMKKFDEALKDYNKAKQLPGLSEEEYKKIEEAISRLKR